jgi:hypothetical protein
MKKIYNRICRKCRKPYKAKCANSNLCKKCRTK